MDKLDAACRNYKRCQKCASDKYGEDCIGELTEYDYVSFGGQNGTPLQHVRIGGDPGSCEQAIFECDHRFALDMAEYHIVNLNYTTGSSLSNWDRKRSRAFIIICPTETRLTQISE